MLLLLYLLILLAAKVLSICPTGTSLLFNAETKSTSILSYEYFECNSLIAIIIPENIKKISSYAFSGCSSLASVTLLSNNMSMIDSYAFSKCHSLTSIELPSGLTALGEGAFYSSGLKSIVVPAGVSLIKDYTFESCLNLASVSLPHGLASIEDSALSNCPSLNLLVIPNRIRSLADVVGFKVERCIHYPDEQLMAYSREYTGSSPACTLPASGICTNSVELILSCPKVVSLTLCLSLPAVYCSSASPCTVMGVYSITDTSYTHNMLVPLPTLPHGVSALVHTASGRSFVGDNKFPLDKYGVVYNSTEHGVSHVYSGEEEGSASPFFIDRDSNDQKLSCMGPLPAAISVGVYSGLLSCMALVLLLLTYIYCLTGSVRLLLVPQRPLYTASEPRYDSQLEGLIAYDRRHLA